MLLSVFSQGDKGTSWYIIWKGSVNVVTHGKVSSSCLPSPWVVPASLVQVLPGSTFSGPKVANLQLSSCLGVLPPCICSECWGAWLGCD